MAAAGMASDSVTMVTYFVFHARLAASWSCTEIVFGDTKKAVLLM